MLIACEDQRPSTPLEKYSALHARNHGLHLPDGRQLVSMASAPLTLNTMAQRFKRI